MRKHRTGRAGWLSRLSAGARNAVELARLGRFSARTGLPYEVVERDRRHRLRRYQPPASSGAPRPPILLVPPLMLTAEIYDVAPDLSSVQQLLDGGLDVWVCDFGAPEREEGGMERTLDDHVLAVVSSVRTARRVTGRDVHLAGYSQGGMFCYQAAAFLGSELLASLITFGSPVDIHRSVPLVDEAVVARMVEALRPVVTPTLRRIEGLPGKLTSTGFRLLSLKKEVQQLAEFVSLLHDRQALEARESRRKFLTGEGFVAWPGPALLKFIDEFIVHNRMVSGGFVIDGRTITLADIRCPIVAFVGLRDEIARPAAVRAILRAAPEAEVVTVPLRAGHFGLVVGSTARAVTWPTVVEHVRWREGLGPRPALFDDPEESRARRVESEEPEDHAFEEPLDLELFWDTAAGAVTGAWRGAGELVRRVGGAVDDLRWQVPRLTRLERMNDGTRISLALSLAQQARRQPDATFFLWKGRAFTYAEADRRVEAVTRGLLASGVRAGTRVGVVMRGRPSFLSAVTALNRLGAEAVIFSPALPEAELRRALRVVPLDQCLSDPDTAETVRRAFDRDVLVLGGGGAPRELGAGLVDLERIDPERVALPAWYRQNPGLARQLAFTFVTCLPGSAPRAARITNGRWAFSALGAAAACTLTPRDTVYGCLPLYHPAGLLVAVSAGVVGGARVAIADGFDEHRFWPDVRRYGATVAFYAGTLCRRLVDLPPSRSDTHHPLRLLAGSGMRADVWHRVKERFGAVGVLEFYASTECNVVLANASGEKVGCVGRRLPGSAEVALVRVDPVTAEPLRDAGGRLSRAPAGEPGLLLSRVDAAHPPPPGDVGPDGRNLPTALLRDVFEEGDVWVSSGDLFVCDADGDHWLLDRVTELIRGAGGWIAPRRIEDALYQLAGVGLAVAFGVVLPGSRGEVPMAVVVPRPGAVMNGEALSGLLGRLPPEARPRFVRFVSTVLTNDGLRPLKGPLRAEGPHAPGIFPTLAYDAEAEVYGALTDRSFARVLRQAGADG